MIFIDSNVFIAYAVEGDTSHEKAVKVVRKIIGGNFGSIYTSDYIFDETTTITLIKSKSLEKAIALGNYIKASIEILKVEEDIFEEAWRIFKEQKNSKFSFTDCTNISLMKNKDIKYIATFDGEFKG